MTSQTAIAATAKTIYVTSEGDSITQVELLDAAEQTLSTQRFLELDDLEELDDYLAAQGLTLTDDEPGAFEDGLVMSVEAIEVLLTEDELSQLAHDGGSNADHTADEVEVFEDYAVVIRIGRQRCIAELQGENYPWLLDSIEDAEVDFALTVQDIKAQIAEWNEHTAA